MSKSLNQTAAEFFKELLNDPVWIKKAQDDIMLMGIAKDCQLITWVAVGVEPNWSIGDSIVYGMDYNYADEQTKKAHNLFYQWHGNGD